ncbi:MAG: hypothetical protein O6918_06865 [Deltaproteobacteria bacterium]|nr:hypothetical protein [Deltaproteobacteria bacterium]
MVRTKKFNNAEMETTYRVLDMDFSGARISFPKAELIPSEAVFTDRERLNATFTDVAYY